MRFFHEVWFDTKYLFKEILLKIKHPKRECDIGYHFEKVHSHFFSHPWYCLKRGIRNLYVWFPMIWKIDVYDHGYLLDLMDKQLKEMEDFWKSGKTMTDHNHIYKRIKWTRKLYQMHKNDHYVMINFEKSGLMDRMMKTEVTKVDEFGVPVLYTLVDTDTKEEKETYNESSRKAYEKDEKVWKLFIKNFSLCRNWWD